MMEKLRAYAEQKGQTMTTAIERIVTEKLDTEGRAGERQTPEGI